MLREHDVTDQCPSRIHCQLTSAVEAYYSIQAAPARPALASNVDRYSPQVPVGGNSSGLPGARTASMIDLLEGSYWKTQTSNPPGPGPIPQWEVLAQPEAAFKFR